MATVEQKHLEGLTFRTSKPSKDPETGKTKYQPVERPLKLTDLLSQTDNGDSFTVVTGDGRKHVIPKVPVTAAAAEDAGGKKGK